MIGSNLQKHFEKIGAQHKVVINRRRNSPPVVMNIISEGRDEVFEISIAESLMENLDLSVLEVKPEDRHLVLLARQLTRGGETLTKNHFLCGHDERHLFVASVGAVSTVAAAKNSLKPKSILETEVGLSESKRNRRKTKNFVRQGEWFFIPTDFVPPDAKLINKHEQLRRGNSKIHLVDFGYRSGGEPVRVCHQHPNGLTQKQYVELIRRNPKAEKWAWRNMIRDAQLYVKGAVRHPDHATIVLDGWHRVLMNTERLTEVVAFLD